MDVPEAPIVEQEAVYKKPKNIFDKTVVFSFSFITFSMSLVLTTLVHDELLRGSVELHDQ